MKTSQWKKPDSCRVGRVSRSGGAGGVGKGSRVSRG